MAKFSCPGMGCGWSSKNGFLSGIKGVECPNCDFETIRFDAEGKHFRCARCGKMWYSIPCPECGTQISNRSGLLGFLDIFKS